MLVVRLWCTCRRPVAKGYAVTGTTAPYRQFDAMSPAGGWRRRLPDSAAGDRQLSVVQAQNSPSRGRKEVSLVRRDRDCKRFHPTRNQAPGWCHRLLTSQSVGPSVARSCGGPACAGFGDRAPADGGSHSVPVFRHGGQGRSHVRAPFDVAELDDGDVVRHNQAIVVNRRHGTSLNGVLVHGVHAPRSSFQNDQPWNDRHGRTGSIATTGPGLTSTVSWQRPNLIRILPSGRDLNENSDVDSNRRDNHSRPDDAGAGPLGWQSWPCGRRSSGFPTGFRSSGLRSSRFRSSRFRSSGFRSSGFRSSGFSGGFWIPPGLSLGILSWHVGMVSTGTLRSDGWRGDSGNSSVVGDARTSRRGPAAARLLDGVRLGCVLTG